MIGLIRKFPALFHKNMEQKAPSFRLEFEMLLGKKMCIRDRPYPEGATIKDVKVQGSTIKAAAYDCANSKGFDADVYKRQIFM